LRGDPWRSRPRRGDPLRRLRRRGRAHGGGRLSEHQRLLAELCSKLGDETGVGALTQQPLELRAIVFCRADAVEDDVADQPAPAALDHAVLDIDFAPVAALDDRHHPGLVTHAGLTAPAHHHAFHGVDRSGEPGDQPALEQLGEHASELVALGGRPRVPLAVERGRRRATDVGDARHQVLDARDLLEWLRADGRVVQHRVDRPEELAQALGRRAGKDRRCGRQDAYAGHGRGEQTAGTPREVHIYNIGRRAPPRIQR